MKLRVVLGVAVAFGAVAGIGLVANRLPRERGLPGLDRVRSSPVTAREVGALVDPHELASPKLDAFSYARVVHAAGDSADALAKTPWHRAVAAVVDADVAEFTVGHDARDPRRAFHPSWLRSASAHFELVGVVPRLDRAFVHPNSCGEMRLVYRLAFQGKDRPVTRLPFTLNALLVVARAADDPSCASVAKLWRDVFDAHVTAERVAKIIPPLASLDRVEINYQSIHVPSYRQDMEDQAEYTLRAFAVAGGSLLPTTLFNTPRADLSAAERATLATWVVEHASDIDAGRAIVPEAFLAKRAVSRSPSGFARSQNRVFKSFVGDESALAAFPFTSSKYATSRRRLLLRLDEMTCPGCHQARSVAGFHLLGRDREPLLHVDALATAGSPQFHDELTWRSGLLRAVAEKSADWADKPFVSHPEGGSGAPGAVCDLNAESKPWTCAAGLTCANLHGGEWGECTERGSPPLGGACESVRRSPSNRPEGDVVDADARACAKSPGAANPICAPTWLGFAGGLCTAPCTRAGERMGDLVCAPLPSQGYEADCLVNPVPIETCMPRHSQLAFVPTCDATRRCRSDYACAAFTGMLGERPGDPAGVCVPPYFLFQTRVDGPIMDR